MFSAHHARLPLFIAIAVFGLAACGGSEDPALTAQDIESSEAVTAQDIESGGVEAASAIEDVRDDLREQAEQLGVVYTIGTGIVEVTLEDGTVLAMAGECEIYRDGFEDTLDFSDEDQISNFYFSQPTDASTAPLAFASYTSEGTSIQLTPADNASFDGENAVAGTGIATQFTAEGGADVQQMTWRANCVNS